MDGDKSNNNQPAEKVVPSQTVDSTGFDALKWATQPRAGSDIEALAREALNEWLEQVRAGLITSSYALKTRNAEFDIERYVPSLGKMLAAHPHSDEMIRSDRAQSWLRALIRILLQ